MLPQTINGKNEESSTYLDILMTGKMGDIHLEELTEHKLVNVRDQDGLWKVTKEVLESFV